MFRNKSVDVHKFAMTPHSDVPRSSFTMEHTYKTTFDAGYLIPVYVDEVLPGDTFNVSMTAFARMSTPLFPVMDNLHLESFFFFVPYRLVWTNFVKMMGEQENPGDSISYTVPQLLCTAGGYALNTVFDYMGLPTAGQVAGANQVTHSVLPLRAYNLIYNQWFRDQNLQNSVTVTKADSGDAVADFALLRRGKRHDYFTGCLPFVQKGTAVGIPLGTTAPVYGNGIAIGLDGFTGSGLGMYTTAAGNLSLSAGNYNQPINTAPSGATGTANKGVALISSPGASGMYADLSSATSATINQLRQSFQIQRFLEKDARGGTRYTEKIREHFRVISPDMRLQRAEYLGGGHTPISINPVAQTSGSGASGTTTALGTLSAVGTALAAGHGFSQSFTEHGLILGLVSVRADLTYQQGLRKMWSRLTQYDFYWPVFQALGEQAVLNKEIYCDGSASDATVFGYQERWAEYRYFPSSITGLFRSTAAGTIDPWHLAQKFTALPTLNTTFIKDTPPVDRVVAVGSGANGKQFLFDSFFRNRAARPMPMYSVPGLIDHF